MRAIKLTQGYETFVDDEDYERLMKYSWHADVQHRTKAGVLYVRAKRSGTVAQDGRNCAVHIQHQILGVMPWQLNGKVIDHEDKNPLNNQKINLRIITKGENNRNTRQKENKLGVSFHKQSGKWIAYFINGRGTQKHLGSFVEREEALRIAAEANKCAQ